MAKLVWQLPVPSTALLDGGPVFEMRPRREVALRMSYEAEEGEQVVALVFEEVGCQVSWAFDRYAPAAVF